VYSPQNPKSGEIITQSVSGSFNTLNPEPPAYQVVSVKASKKPANGRKVFAKVNPINPLDLENSLDPSESQSSSISNSLDSKSDPAYCPSPSPSPSSSTLGSNHNSFDYVDMVPPRRISRPQKKASISEIWDHHRDDEMNVRPSQDGPSQVGCSTPVPSLTI
jgi:hypothetical protein